MVACARSRPGGKNLCSLLDQARLTGRSPRSWNGMWDQLPPAVMKTTNEVFHDIPFFLVTLKAACCVQDSRKMRQVLNEISRLVCQPHRASARRSLFVCGGADLLLSILFTDAPWLQQSLWVGPIWDTTLKLLKEMSQTMGSQVPLYLCSREPQLLNRLFRMLRYKATFESAANVTEDILSTTSALVNVGKDFSDFPALMNRLSVRHRALFCRVLALFIYSPHSSANVQLQASLNPAENPHVAEVDAIIDRNQSQVIDDANLLSKIVNLLKYQINVIDSLQYGNFLALLISINDEPAPGVAPLAPQGPSLPSAPLQTPPVPAPLSSLFSAALDSGAGDVVEPFPSVSPFPPNLSDALLAGGFPMGGVYETPSTGSPRTPPSNSTVPPVDTLATMSTSTTPGPHLAFDPSPLTSRSSTNTPGPSAAAISSSSSFDDTMLSSPPPSFPDHFPDLATPPLLSPDAAAPWNSPPPPYAWPSTPPSPVLSSPRPRRPSRLLMPRTASGLSDTEDSNSPNRRDPPILSALLSSLPASPLTIPALSSDIDYSTPLGSPPMPGSLYELFEAAGSDEGDADTLLTPLLDSDRAFSVEDGEGGPRHTPPGTPPPGSPLMPELLSRPPPLSPTDILAPLTPRIASPPAVSPPFMSTHGTVGHSGVATSSASARTSFLDYLDSSAAPEEDEAVGSNRRLSLQSLTVVSCQVEVLFVLSALLSGKRKVEVRERLTALKLLGVLNDIFAFIFWEKKRDAQHLSQSLVSAIASALGNSMGEPSDASFTLGSPSVELGGAPPDTAPPEPVSMPIPLQQHPFNSAHPPDCDCRPEAARRIQYLRLIHKYCDCADYHHLHRADPETRESKRRLARKLVGCLIRHQADTNCRYWLASCLEAVLRGNHWHHRHEDQLFIADRDLLPHLLHDVVSCMEGGHTTTRLQSSFDLLAELIKFNRTLFNDLNALLAADATLYARLREVVCGQLVHSNVFLRSIILSLHFFRPNSLLHTCDHCAANARNHAFAKGIQIRDGRICAVSSSSYPTPKRRSHSLSGSSSGASGLAATCQNCEFRGQPEAFATPYTFSRCLLTRFVRDYKVQLVRNLMVEIRLEQINKENICCINTALVFFLFAQEKGSLERLLWSIKQNEEEQAHEFRMTYSMPLAQQLWVAGEDGDSCCDMFGRRDPFRNFHKLMRYWVVYYEGRTHDTETIFHSSRIPWDKWWNTVVMLLKLLPKFYTTPPTAPVVVC